MSRSFNDLRRNSDAFAETRRALADRKAAREDRRREFAEMGFEAEADALAALPIFGEVRREAARRALRG
jgi:hypothetical protein